MHVAAFSFLSPCPPRVLPFPSVPPSPSPLRDPTLAAYFPLRPPFFTARPRAQPAHRARKARAWRRAGLAVRLDNVFQVPPAGRLEPHRRAADTANLVAPAWRRDCPASSTRQRGSPR